MNGSWAHFQSGAGGEVNIQLGYLGTDINSILCWNAQQEKGKGDAKNEPWVSGYTRRGWQCFYLCVMRLHGRRPCDVGSNVHRDSGGMESCWAPWHVHRGLIHGPEGPSVLLTGKATVAGKCGERGQMKRDLSWYSRALPNPGPCFKPKLRHTQRHPQQIFRCSARAQRVTRGL